jgi:glutamate racemase
MNIGFFDSGLGGLIILKAVAKALPQYDYVYYGDTANVPYGDKTEEEIYTLTKAALTELFLRDCLLVIVACNTASAETLRRIQDMFLVSEYPDRRVLGVIIPTIEEVVKPHYKKALLLATKRTVESSKYQKELDKLGDTTQLISIATPELVPFIELGEIEIAAKSAIATIERNGVGDGDVVVLGCTHYCLLKDSLREHFGPAVTIVSQDEVIPQKLTTYLEQHPEITSRLHDTGKRVIHLTQHRPDYDRLTAEFLGGAYLPDED